jgi:hypothetical protein
MNERLSDMTPYGMLMYRRTMEGSYMDSLVVDIEDAVFWECQAYSMLKPLFVDFGKTVSQL